MILLEIITRAPTFNDYVHNVQRQVRAHLFVLSKPIFIIIF